MEPAQLTLPGSVAIRFTLYGVSADARTWDPLSSGVPCGHFDSERDSLSAVEELSFCRPVRIVEREREYPYRVLRIVRAWDPPELSDVSEDPKAP